MKASGSIRISWLSTVKDWMMLQAPHVRSDLDAATKNSFVTMRWKIADGRLLKQPLIGGISLHERVIRSVRQP